MGFGRGNLIEVTLCGAGGIRVSPTLRLFIARTHRSVRRIGNKEQTANYETQLGEKYIYKRSTAATFPPRKAH